MGNFTAKREEGEKTMVLQENLKVSVIILFLYPLKTGPAKMGVPVMSCLCIVYVYVFCGCAVIEAEPEPVVGFLQAFTLPALKPRWKNKITAVDGSRLRRVAFVSFRSKAGEQLFLGSHSIIIMAGCQQAA